MSSGTPIAREWFGRPPEAAGSDRECEVSVALWRIDRDDPWEFRTAPLPETHVICAHLGGRMAWEADLGDYRYARPCLPGTSCMGLAGGTGQVALRNAHATFVHFYVPTSWLSACVEDFVPSWGSGGIELFDPMNARTPEVHRCALMAASALREGGTAARLEIEAATLLLAAALLRHHSNIGQATRRPVHGGLAGWQLRRVMDAMAQAKGEHLSLAELAGLVDLSPAHFCTAFRQSTGLPPHAWQRERRVEDAKDLLAHSAHSLADVALECGFANQSHFTRVFRQLTGTTPARYRSSVRE